MMIAAWLANAAAPRGPSSRPVGDVLPWLILLVGLIIVGGVAIYFFRRWMWHDSRSSTAGFTLQDLRDLHARGELTDEEFNAAKAAMIGRLAEPAKSQEPKLTSDESSRD